MAKNHSKLRKALVPSLVTVAVVGVLAFFWNLSAYYLGTQMARMVYLAAPLFLAVVLPALIALAMIVAACTIKPGPARWGWNATEEEKAAAAAKNRQRRRIALMVAVAVILPMLWLVQGYRWANRYGYETSVVYTANLVVEPEATPPSYETRLSVPQARLQLTQALSGTSGKLGDVTYIGNQEAGEYCATVLRNGTLGRVWTREILCLDPATGATRQAEFTGNVGAPEGFWSSKLGDQVASVRRGLVFDHNDIYGYITEDGDARLVVPVRFATGGSNTRYDVAAGVVLFDTDGSREYIATVEPGAIPGPVMPMSVASEIRANVNSTRGFLVHREPRRSDQSLESTSTAEGVAATDPNAENASEFVLVRDGRLYYVTPLTPYGQSQTVVAYLEVAADEVTAGVMPTATLYRLAQPLASLQLITQRVTTLYDADIDWMETNTATDASNRARIYEITPSASGQVTLTVGTGTQTLYRVFVEAGLDEQNEFGEICIYRFKTDVKIRCDASDADPTPVGSLRGIAGGTNGSGSNPNTTPAAAVGGTDLSNVPTQDLLDEIARRIDG
jgi:hypothetical protein